MPQSISSRVESQHQVPRLKRFLWGLGGFTDATIIYGMFSLVSAVYINALGVNAVLISLACAISRFLDSVSDPLVGHLSDNTCSRWSRRRPWLLAGLVMSAVFGMLLWYAPLSNPIALPPSTLAATEITAEATESAQVRNTNSDDISVSGDRNL